MPLNTSDSKQNIPAAGTTVTYIPDKPAGWMYIVTIHTDVQQAPITYLDDQITLEEQAITGKQAKIVELRATKAEVDAVTIVK